MRVARLEITRFRGFESFTYVPREHVVVVGEPRAGRSDLIAALRRVLDPRSILARPSEWDMFRPFPQPEGSDELGMDAPSTTIDVSLLGLPDEAEHELEGRLELLDPGSGELVIAGTADHAELGIRLRYCLRHDSDEDRLEHWLEYPKSGIRVPRADRNLLRAFVVDRNPPLQLRAEGVFRQLANDQNPDALGEKLRQFANRIRDATENLAQGGEIQAALTLVATSGATETLGLNLADPQTAVGFAAEDGSLSALLRAIQPTLELDAAGKLPLSAHGSTTAAILSSAEASAAAKTVDAIVLADDFGDNLDGASSEYLASRLRRQSGQLWLTTRQPEVVRAFEPTELLRLTRRAGRREAFQLSTNPSRQDRVRRRHLFTILGAAMSARTVVLLEGPHDLETYAAVAHRRFIELDEVPLSAHGTRLVPASASGAEGGKQELPKIARLATELGLAVRVVLDHDKPGTDSELIEELRAVAEMIVRLSERAAVERAIVDGLAVDELRQALMKVQKDYELPVDVDGVSDDDLASRCVWALKQKGGLHRAFVDALPKGVIPPLASSVLKHLEVSNPHPDPLITLDLP